MIIESKRIDTSTLMLGICKMLACPSYFPLIRTYEFTFSGEPIFSMQHLQDLVPHSPIAGTIETTTVNDLQTMLLPIMATEANEHGEIYQTTNEDLIISRVIFFWDCVKSEFYQPITHYFIHKPAPGSYFIQTTQWSFCFIILNETKGMVVTGKTWNNAAECPPENDIEANFRSGQDML